MMQINQTSNVLLDYFWFPPDLNDPDINETRSPAPIFNNLISVNLGNVMGGRKNFIGDHLRGFLVCLELTVTPRQSNNQDECHLKHCKVDRLHLVKSEVSLILQITSPTEILSHPSWSPAPGPEWSKTETPGEVKRVTRPKCSSLDSL